MLRMNVLTRATERDFTFALQSNDVAMARHLLEGGEPVDGVLPSGLTPLMVAIGRNATDIIYLLAVSGADVNAPQGAPPLRPLAWASLAGSARETVRVLIDLGAIVDRSTITMARSVARAGLGNAHLDLALAHRRRGSLGVILARHDVAAFALSRAGASNGAPLLNVARYSGAERAGICTADIVVAIGGRPVRDADGVVRALAAAQSGDTMVLRVLRDGRITEKAVELQPADPHAAHVV
jgi:PDZ domain/Ankyrin repeat